MDGERKPSPSRVLKSAHRAAQRAVRIQLNEPSARLSLREFARQAATSTPLPGAKQATLPAMAEQWILNKGIKP